MFLRKMWFIALLLACFMLPENAFAQDVYLDFVQDEDKHPYDYKMWDRYGKYQQKVNEVGFRLLNANEFNRRVKFVVVQSNRSKQVVNASANYYSGRIKIYKGMLIFIDNDDELAAILAHELGHIKQFNTGNWLWKRLKMHFAPRIYEHDADLKGIDYMVKAGYNPLAMISLGNKIYHEKSAFARIDYFLADLSTLFLLRINSHPSGSERILKMYNHIQEKYPRFLVNEHNNTYYVNFLMKQDKNRHINVLKDKHGLITPIDMGENL